MHQISDGLAKRLVAYEETIMSSKAVETNGSPSTCGSDLD